MTLKIYYRNIQTKMIEKNILEWRINKSVLECIYIWIVLNTFVRVPLREKGGNRGWKKAELAEDYGLLETVAEY